MWTCVCKPGSGEAETGESLGLAGQMVELRPVRGADANTKVDSG